ncbi:MAG: low molecular weight protein-tyrosine-phosphatase [Crocinitomicaceae bacterium]
MKILMVCLGNICRSPLADGLLRKKVKEKKLSVEVDSAGTSGIHSGKSPDIRMQKVAASFQTPIDFLTSRKFTKSDFKNFDLILVMDKSNKSNVLQLAETNEEKEKVKLILDYLSPNEQLEVPDPYYGGEDGFIEVYHLLNKATDNIISELDKISYD